MKKLLLFFPFFILGKDLIIKNDLATYVYDTNLHATKLVIFKFKHNHEINIKKRFGFYDSIEKVKHCYTHSGFDRGHLIADRFVDYNKTILKLSYSMLNIIPEKPLINRYRIKNYEKYLDNSNIKYLIIKIIYSNKHLKDNPKCPAIPKEIIYINENGIKKFLQKF